MSLTLVGDLANQAQKFWSPLLKDELKQDTMLASLVSKEYQGEIKKGGDTVYVTQIDRPTGSIKTIGVDHDTYTSEKLTTTRISIAANKIVEASIELDNLVDLQTQLGEPSAKQTIRKAMLEACEIKLNSYLYSQVAPSASAPDHIINAVADFNASQAANVRKLAAQARWAKDGGWWLLLDPSYFSDFLSAATLTSSDYVGGDAPVVGGQFATKRFGFNVLEDNSDGILTLGTSGVDCGLAFHPDFLHLVMGAPEFKLSDLHANKRRGYLLTCEFLVGSALGIDGDKKHIRIYNT